MHRRHVNRKIPDIKAIRSLTRLLGRLGIKSCTRRSHGSFNGEPVVITGLGLKETKDYVEARFEYYNDSFPVERWGD